MVLIASIAVLVLLTGAVLMVLTRARRVRARRIARRVRHAHREQVWSEMLRKAAGPTSMR